MTKNEKNSAATAVVEPKRYEAAFKRQAVEHWLCSGKNGTQITQERGISHPSLKERERRRGGNAEPQRAGLEARHRALRAELARCASSATSKKNAGHPLGSAAERYECIEAMKGEHSLATLCAAFGVSQTDCHRWNDAEPATRAREAARLCEAILVVHGEHRSVHDNPRVQRELPKRGRRHGRKRIARLMRAASLRGKCPRRFVPCITHSRRAEPIAPNRLAEHPKPTVPNQVWMSDIAHVRTGEGWLYVAAIMDLHSHRIVGWATGAGLAADLVLAALAMALRHRRPPAELLHRSDRGVQHACGGFRAVLAEARLIASMSRKVNRYDNGATLDCIEPERSGDSRRQAFHNRVRLHGALGYQSPVDFETQLNQHSSPAVTGVHQTKASLMPPACVVYQWLVHSL